MQKKLIVLVISIAFANQSCKFSDQNKKVNPVITDSIVHMALLDFKSSMGKNHMMNHTDYYIIDTIGFPTEYDDWNIMQAFPLVERNSEKIKINSRETGEIFAKYLKMYYPQGKIAFQNDTIFNMPIRQREEKLRNENSVSFKYSDVYWIKAKDEYFMSFHYSCGRLCGGEYYFKFRINDQGKIENIELSRAEA